YYNGKVEYDKDRYDSFLTCSLMIYHNKLSGTARNDRSIEKIVPVWWDFSLSAEGRAQAHDFCWSYFSTFFPFA
ncbi:MAG: hypothetical protein LUD68_08590, partial [Rikenellaceae bacterium]|nr:hypothetical protein [Rikenellaceae bacterium]